MNARCISTPHGLLELPAFFPDGTRAVVRGLDAADLEACDLQGVMVNAFHLMAGGRTRIIAAHGGVHKFMGWSRPVAADSGGFQLYSLIEESPKRGSVSNRGFLYRAEAHKRLLFTPAKCIQTQFRLKADLMFCLDECTHPASPHEKQRESVNRTVAWARACRQIYDELLDACQFSEKERPLLFAVIQGGGDASLRRECAERLLEIGFDGYGYGGWPVGEDGCLNDSVGLVAELVPKDIPKFALGIGKPENLVRAFEIGYDLFDCTIPTRDARHGRIYVFNEPPETTPPLGTDFYHFLYLQDRTHSRDERPLEEGCDCPCCRRYTRAYLHHLFRLGDALAGRLASCHNLRFYRRLMAALARRRETVEHSRPK